MTVSARPSPLSSQAYWNQDLETRSRAAWRADSLAQLQRHLKFAYENAPFYRAHFDAAGVRPEHLRTLDDLRRFPFIDKKILRDRQIAVPPFGDLCAVPGSREERHRRIVRAHP